MVRSGYSSDRFGNDAFSAFEIHGRHSSVDVAWKSNPPTRARISLQLAETFTEKGITTYVADCGPKVLSIFKKAQTFRAIPETQFFPSVHDAVMHTHDGHHGPHRHLSSIGRQASFNETFGPDSLATDATVFEHKIDLTDENDNSSKF